MKTQDFSALKSQLTSMRELLLAQIAAQRGGHVGRAEAAAEQFSRREDSDAQVATERDLSFAIDEHETAELIAIDSALARLADGSYGECTDCACRIPLARLQATPEAARCIACQEKIEKLARGH